MRYETIDMVCAYVPQSQEPPLHIGEVCLEPHPNGLFLRSEYALNLKFKS